ncbi:hypothetical protein GQ600_2744 [Phytophthora cactorum]|nr:hypothetical protein GQ600_2744 [Phytophthora cactorum]
MKLVDGLLVSCVTVSWIWFHAWVFR